jgi:GNAT superfamily N-acetyltransferase
MIITFEEYLPIEDTMVFEDVFEEELQLDEDEKSKIINAGWPLWMFVDGELAGETYGIRLRTLKEEIEDCKNLDKNSVYCYSTALLPKFRGKNLGPILKAYWIGMMRGMHQRAIIGHATSSQAKKLNEMFGAQFGNVHTMWYGTERTAVFYWINL